MEESTQARFDEWRELTKTALFDLEAAARYWANKMKGKELRSDLYQIERKARWLWHHVKCLAPPAGDAR